MSRAKGGIEMKRIAFVALSLTLLRSRLLG